MVYIKLYDLNRVCKRLLDEKIIYFTIHDSVCVKESDFKIAESIFNEEFEKYKIVFKHDGIESSLKYKQIENPIIINHQNTFIYIFLIIGLKKFVNISRFSLNHCN